MLNALPQSGGGASQILVPVGPLPVDPDAIRVPSSAAADLAVREVGQFTSLDFLNSYSWVFIVAFVVTLVATPFVRHLAIAMEIVDKPNEARKQHKFPIAYLGGFAVFLGVMAGIAYSYTIQSGPAATFAPIPVSIVIGIVAITFTGLADDVWGWDPRLKIAGQLVAAAARAVQDIGTRVAEGVLQPLLYLAAQFGGDFNDDIGAIAENIHDQFPIITVR